MSSKPHDPFDLPGPLGSLSEDTSVGGAKVVIAIGTVVLIALAVGLVFLGRGAIRKESLRRGVNVAWDVIAFWPRAVHPFVPPPYSQRAVADLHDRICWHLDHAVPLVDDRTGLDVAQARHVVTFGSQLRVAFPRAFAAYINYPVLEWLYKQLGGRWVSLYRDTDAIAGPVLSWGHSRDGVGATPESHRILQTDSSTRDVIHPTWGRRICGPEWRLLDPTPYDVALQQGPVPKIQAHSNYPDDPAWPDALDAVSPSAPTVAAEPKTVRLTGIAKTRRNPVDGE